MATTREKNGSGVVLLPEVDKPKVEENCLVVGAHLQGPFVDGDGLIGAAGARVDDAEIAERRDVSGLLAEYRLEPALRSLGIPGGQGFYGSVEDLLRRIGGSEHAGAETQARGELHSNHNLSQTRPD